MGARSAWCKTRSGACSTWEAASTFGRAAGWSRTSREGQTDPRCFVAPSPVIAGGAPGQVKAPEGMAAAIEWNHPAAQDRELVSLKTLTGEPGVAFAHLRQSSLIAHSCLSSATAGAGYLTNCTGGRRISIKEHRMQSGPTRRFVVATLSVTVLITGFVVLATAGIAAPTTLRSASHETFRATDEYHRTIQVVRAGTTF